MWALALHGGATEIAPEEEDAYRTGCLRALEAGRAILEGGGSAVEAAAAAVRVLEDDPTFNAGTGAARNEDGEIEMCAALMDGRSLGIGAVAVIREVRNPIAVALALLDEEPVVLGAEGALRFARDKGLAGPSQRPLRVAGSDGRRAHDHDTVGCVTLDRSGRVAAATSTGGLDGCKAGRLGDSAMPGCGFYADDGMGAVVLSGDGEPIARAMAAARILHRLDSRGPRGAITETLARVSALKGEAGAVLVTPDGAIASAHTSRDFCVASQREGDSGPRISLRDRGD